MTPRKVIDQAKNVLAASGSLKEILNRTGSVLIPVMPDAQFTPDRSPPTNDPGWAVTFTFEETAFGKRLIAEFEGFKEFAA